MTDLVLDAPALLAVLQQERGAERWATSIEGAAISTVNVSEVVAKLLETDMPVDHALAVLDELGLAVVDFDLAQAVAAAQLRARTRRLGLSMGDRACLALAQTKKLAVLTADRAWADLRLGIKINLVR